MLTTIYHYILAHKEPLLALVGGAAGLSAFAELILHKLKVNFTLDSKLFSFVLVQLLVGIASLASWILAHENLEIVTPWLATLAAVAHRFVVSPLYTNKVLPWLEKRAAKKSAFEQWLETQKPTEPLVPESTSTTPQIV